MYKLLLVDLDGVVWRGETPIEENICALKEIGKRGITIVYATNNSSRSRLEYLSRLRSLGVDATLDNIITSGLIVAEYLRSIGGGAAFVIGEAGLIEELIVAGIRVVADAPNVDYVVVGYDRHLTYSKLAAATKYILKGAKFIAANMDSTLPTEEGLVPGAGAIVAALTTATGRKPDFIGGKPNPWIIDFVERRYGVPRNEILIIGDRLDTDIKLGLDTGVDTMLVLTGVTKPYDPMIRVYRPKYIVRNLTEALKIIT